MTRVVRILWWCQLLFRVCGGNETPFTAKDLDAAEIVLMTCGLTPERAAALRAELERNKAISVETNIDHAVAKKFRYARL
jgi:hypothetical protein